MVISAVTGGASTPKTMDVPANIDSAVVRQIEGDKKIQNQNSTETTEAYVRDYFKDIPIMIEVAKCESHFQHLDKNGEIHRGVVNSADIGVMQINEFYHLERSVEENYNIYTLQGNTAYARNLYGREGTNPWNSSKSCWGKYENRELAINKK